jgi:hypothetical protein
MHRQHHSSSGTPAILACVPLHEPKFDYALELARSVRACGFRRCRGEEYLACA